METGHTDTGESINAGSAPGSDDSPPGDKSDPEPEDEGGFWSGIWSGLTNHTSIADEGPDAITSKMDRDYSATQQALDNKLQNDNAWTQVEERLYAASAGYSAINGWPDNLTGSIGGCTDCHDGRFDTHH